MEDTTQPEDIQGTQPELETVVPGAAVAEADPPDTDLDPDAPEGDTPDPEPKPKPSGVEKRVSELTYHRRQAERREAKAQEEAAYWRGIAEGRGGAQGTPQGQQPAKDVPPKHEDFRTYDEYIGAVAEHRLQAAMAKYAEKNRRDAEARHAETHQQEVHAGFAQRAEAFRETNPDFDYQGLAQDPDLAISTHMADAIHNLDDGPAILHHLSNNKKEAQRIYGLAPARQIYEIAAISHRLANPPAPKPRPASTAPAPIKPLTGAAKAVEGLTDGMSTAQWMAQRGKEVRKR